VAVGEAARLLGISERQMKRVRARLPRREGPSALAHGNRGRRPANAVEMGLTSVGGEVMDPVGVT
jgi:hypothetical protein